VNANIVDGDDVGMTEPRHRPCFLLEASMSVWIARKFPWQDLDGDVAPQARVVGAVHLAHATSPEMADDFERADVGAR
jgi:hypothetical protein